jgi:hypothetical protein
LITILLYFAIPPELHRQAFDPAIVLFVIVGTSLVLTYGLIVHGKETTWTGELAFNDWDELDKEITELQQKNAGIRKK